MTPGPARSVEEKLIRSNAEPVRVVVAMLGLSC